MERLLNDLFLKELNSRNSIFIKISPNLVHKIALFLSGVALRPAAIGVCGETASGKSTIVLDSIKVVSDFSEEFLRKNIVTRINTDDYYYDRSKEVKEAGSFAEFAKNYDLDVPQAIELNLLKRHIGTLLNNKNVYLPKYDMSGTAKRYENQNLAVPSPIIITEGLFTLVDEIEDVFDFKIYVDVTTKIQKERFFRRAEERGLGDSADKIFNNAKKKAEVYVQPCAKNADIILNGEIDRERFKHFTACLMNLIESVNYNVSI
jgi:uridine kinase